MHHSDQLYVPGTTRLLYPSPLIVFSKCQEQTNRRRGHTSHLATMRPNAKQGGGDAMHGYSFCFIPFFFFLLYFLDQISKLRTLPGPPLFFPVFDTVMPSLPRWPPRWPSNYTSPQNRKVGSRQSTTPSRREISHYSVILLWIKTTGRVKHRH